MRRSNRSASPWKRASRHTEGKTCETQRRPRRARWRPTNWASTGVRGLQEVQCERFTPLVYQTNNLIYFKYDFWYIYWRRNSDIKLVTFLIAEIVYISRFIGLHGFPLQSLPVNYSGPSYHAADMHPSPNPLPTPHTHTQDMTTLFKSCWGLPEEPLVGRDTGLDLWEPLRLWASHR